MHSKYGIKCGKKIFLSCWGTKATSEMKQTKPKMLDLFFVFLFFFSCWR